MMLIVVLALIVVPLQAVNFTAVGEAVSILALGISLPHGLFLREHSRALDFLQTNYLILSFPPGQELKNEQPLAYSVASFLPNFLPTHSAYFTAIGSYFSFALVLIGTFTLFYVVFTIEKRFDSSLSFSGWSMVFQSLVDWIYLILVRINLRFFVAIIVDGTQLSASILELSMMCLTIAAVVGYHLLLANVSVGMPDQPTQQQLHQQKRRRISDFIMFMKSCTLALLMAFIEALSYRPLIYAYFGVFLAHFLLQYFFYDFVGITEKVVVGVLHLLNMGSLLTVVLEKDQVIVYFLVVAGFLLEILISTYKLYRMLTRASKPGMQVYPMPLDQPTKRKDILSPPHPSKDGDASMGNRYDQDNTELQLEVVVPPIRAKSLRKRLVQKKKQLSESIFKSQAVL